MLIEIRKRSLLLAGAASLPLSPLAAQTAPGQPAPATAQSPSPASAQPAPAGQTDLDQIDSYEGDGEGEIVITGARARGSVVGDIPPESTLDSRDVRATGATNINELLDALAPQLGSSQGRSGGRPVMLLDGKRISGFRELRDIPTEAIERVDILPEEVALKYGYGADQKVVNIVLRQRFHSTAINLGAGAATAGGYASANADGTRLAINRGGRTTINLHAEGNSLLTENERDIALDPTEGNDAARLAGRSLVGTKRVVRGSGTVNRTIWGDVSATVNGEVEHDEGRSLIGLGDTLLLPLARHSDSDSAHLGFALNGSKDKWQWSVTGNGDLDRSRTRTDIDDPQNPFDRARETTTSGDITATANGSLFKLPAGDASTTLTVAGSTVHLKSESDPDARQTSLGRSAGRAAINVDLPISRRNRDFSGLGNLTLNANAEVNQLSDFGTLTKLGAGANFSPVDRLNFIASWSREEGPPTINQLGDPVLRTEGARIFDFTRNETVLATAITGGNPALRADKRTVMKLGGNWQPFSKVELRLRADYVHSRIDNPIQNIFGPTPALEAAFPDRFQRDSAGQLVSVDLRPINFDEARRDTLRLGVDFSKPLKSKRPSQAVMDQMRAQFRRDRGTPATSTPAAPAPSETPPKGQNGTAPATPPNGSVAPPAEASPSGDSGRGFRGGGRGGGFFGGGSRGRLQFSLADTITFVDKVSIGPGLPVLDYLHGEAAGGSGGTPRHTIEAQAGWSNNGLGARLSADWRSGTTVNSLSGDNLRFSPLATFDLRLFANLGDRPELALKHPWLRGTSVRFSVDNIFDSKPRVHDAAGNVPLNYQPDLLDPLGRTVMISLRKLFYPSPASFMRQRERDQAAGS